VQAQGKACDHKLDTPVGQVNGLPQWSVGRPGWLSHKVLSPTLASNPLSSCVLGAQSGREVKAAVKCRFL